VSGVCRDRFTVDVPPGAVVGSVGPAGARRLGVDAEGRIGIDHGALRLRPLAEPGWGREGIAYEPPALVPGLAFAALVLNGHNASQTFYFPESARQRARRVVADVVRLRPRRQHHYENLAVGFLDDPATVDPLGGHAFVMHAATEDNGELWVTHGGRPARVVRGVQNLPFVYVVALRARGAAFYTASLPGATGAAPYPMLRPVGIDPVPAPGARVAGIQQRILGEVGYRVDSRVYGVELAVVEGWRRWYGTAVAADRLAWWGPAEPLGARPAEAGGRWHVVGPGRLVRSPEGARAAAAAVAVAPVAAYLDPGVAAGLVHAVVRRGRGSGIAELRWRVGLGGAHLAVVVGPRGCEVVARDGAGGTRTLAVAAGLGLPPRSSRAVQVLDDGSRLAVHVDGDLVGGGWSEVPEGGGTGVGLAVAGDVAVADFEAHPREVPLPGALDCGAPWSPPPSGPMLHERFDTVAPDLHGTATSSGQRRWERVEGTGVVEVLGDRARVRADRTHPFPDRAVFTIPWDDPGHARLELEMTVPGTGRGEGHGGRAGVVFWQDPDNYLVVNVFVDDVFDGASISTFYHLDGHEDMYDAVWTLVRGVTWGRRCTLSATFDGERFLAGIDSEPCLVRALADVYPGTPPLRIERVGIVVNEEWGNDTGTVLHRFSAAGPGPAACPNALPAACPNAVPAACPNAVPAACPNAVPAACPNALVA
jgi:hypothetical protein